MEVSPVKPLVFALFLALCALPAASAAPAPVPTAEQADGYFQKGDWEDCIKAYEAIAAAQPGDGQAWFRLGFARHALGRFPAASEAYGKAAASGLNTPQLHYRTARVYAQLKNPDAAFAALDRAIAAGFTQVTLLQAETDFASIRSDPRFAKAAAAADHNAHPCRTGAEYRQLDFWLGEWDVEVKGQRVARSSIQLILEDCVIFENYDHGSGAYTGKSFSLWDASSKQWIQKYVDSTGDLHDYVGELVNGEMRFRRETTAADGTKTLHKMTFYNQGPDKVRQTLEASTDGGKTWANTFDGTYVRRR
jgi:tetratricopeptide (TPR) repeat protein